MTPPPRKTLASEWAEFALAMLRNDLPLHERAQAKQVFFTGALCAMTILGESIEGPPELGMRRLIGQVIVLGDECRAFAQDRINEL